MQDPISTEGHKFQNEWADYTRKYNDKIELFA
jgi:hypothetical protein